MKQIARLFLILALLLAALCVTVLAEGIYITDAATGVTITPVSENTETVKIGGEDRTVYTDAEKITVKLSETTKDRFYLILSLEEDGEGTPVPSTSNIRYIDQMTSAGGTLTFTVYPDKLESDATYGIYAASSDGNGLEKVGEYKYFSGEPVYEIGDANGDSKINVDDAVKILKCIVGNDEFTPNQKIAADANGDGKVDVNDAVAVLKFIVGNGELGKH